jgi:glutamine synthetase
VAKTPADVLNLIKEQGIKIVDARFIDMPGVWQHFSMPAEEFTADSFTEGLGFDGSSIRGFQQIQESDMLLFPDASTAFVDPFTKHPTLNIICDVKDPLTHDDYSRDPRYIARKAEAYVKQSGLADTVYFGPEAEFFIFDDARFDQNAHSGYYFLDSVEAAWNTGRVEEGGNKAYKIRHKEGYFPCSPMDRYQDLRSDMVLTMKEMGMRVELHHHEVATAGQCEIDLRFLPLLEMADTLMKYKYAIKNVAFNAGKTVTFMPKPLFQDNGSGMHCHQSLWKGGQPLFYDEAGYAGLSEMAIYYIGGLLKHAPALLAFTNPTTNSYRRLVPGYEAPVNLMYSQRNRSACVRIPMYSSSPKAKRIEFRCPDPSCNPYLAFSAMLMAGIDGIENRIMPPAPIDKDLYELEPSEKSEIKQTPGSLAEVLNALEADHQFLLRGGVFTPDVIETWIDYKRTRELEQVNLRPHPYEFFLYYDI